jgi:hypothetical protein
VFVVLVILQLRVRVTTVLQGNIPCLRLSLDFIGILLVVLFRRPPRDALVEQRTVVRALTFPFESTQIFRGNVAV